MASRNPGTSSIPARPSNFGDHGTSTAEAAQNEGPASGSWQTILTGAIAWVYIQADAIFYGARATLGLGGLSSRDLTVGKWFLAVCAVVSLMTVQKRKRANAAFNGKALTALLFAIVATSSYGNYVRYAGDDPVRKYLLYILSLALPALIVGICVSVDDLVKARRFGLYVSALAVALMLVANRQNSVIDAGYLNDVGGASHLLVGQTSVIALILATYVLMSREPGRVVSSFLLLTSIYLLLISGSRGSLIAGICAVLYYSSSVVRNLGSSRSRSRKSLQVFSFIIIGIAAGSYFYSGLQADSLARQKFESLFAGGDQSTTIRQYLYGVAEDMIRQHPVFGSGVGGYAEHMGIYIYPHNLVLELLCDFGVFGLILVAIILRRIWKNWHSPSESVAGTFLVASTVILLFSGSYAIQPLFWFSLALAAPPALRIISHNRDRREAQRSVGLSLTRAHPPKRA